MKQESNISFIPSERIEQSIWLIRKQKVMLDSELASLYQVETKVLNQAVQRNIGRFPDDFMFQLAEQEFSNLKSQIVTSSLWGGKRKLPFVFTEQGIAMLSSVLRSERAVQVNIAIMRAFVKLRGMMQSQSLIKREIASLKLQYQDHDEQIKSIFMMIDEIIAPPTPKKKRGIGFVKNLDEE